MSNGLAMCSQQDQLDFTLLSISCLRVKHPTRMMRNNLSHGESKQVCRMQANRLLFLMTGPNISSQSHFVLASCFHLLQECMPMAIVSGLRKDPMLYEPRLGLTGHFFVMDSLAASKQDDHVARASNIYDQPIQNV